MHALLKFFLLYSISTNLDFFGYILHSLRSSKNTSQNTHNVVQPSQQFGHAVVKIGFWLIKQVFLR